MYVCFMVYKKAQIFSGVLRKRKGDFEDSMTDDESSESLCDTLWERMTSLYSRYQVICLDTYMLLVKSSRVKFISFWSHLGFYIRIGIIIFGHLLFYLVRICGLMLLPIFIKFCDSLFFDSIAEYTYICRRSDEAYHVDFSFPNWLKLFGWVLFKNRITPFRNSSVDKWQRKTQLATGAGAIKGKLQAFIQVKLVDHPLCVGLLVASVIYLLSAWFMRLLL